MQPATTSPGDGWMGLILVVILGCIYFIPAFVAWGNGKRNREAILVLNLLLGWTVVGWIGALVWACMRDAEPALSREDVAELLASKPSALSSASFHAEHPITVEEIEQARERLRAREAGSS